MVAGWLAPGRRAAPVAWHTLRQTNISINDKHTWLAVHHGTWGRDYRRGKAEPGGVEGRQARGRRAHMRTNGISRRRVAVAAVRRVRDLAALHWHGAWVWHGPLSSNSCNDNVRKTAATRRWRRRAALRSLGFGATAPYHNRSTPFCVIALAGTTVISISVQKRFSVCINARSALRRAFFGAAYALSLRCAFAACRHIPATIWI